MLRVLSLEQLQPVLELGDAKLELFHGLLRRDAEIGGNAGCLALGCVAQAACLPPPALENVCDGGSNLVALHTQPARKLRSEERRVGKECRL